ncbi:hypothetical protein OIU79_019871 [Salix purpurea]|uniref:Uncharacterized protein n=1 Tax=Salix purpurea TaxID=77065 RepID=A0A9Q0SKD2_SALPP|nr:hypothetical protein OIU79_019871 [Salix purpurea]
MDRLVKADVKEVEIAYERSQNGSATFRITNLMHTMSVAISLSITNPSVFSFSQPFSTIPPLSSSSYTVVLSDQPPLSASADAITVKSSMLPTGKAHQDELRRLFSRPGPHVFRDATIPVYLVGPQFAEYIISNHTKIPDVSCFFNRAICGCTGTQITGLLRSAVLSGDQNLVTNLIDHGGDVNCKDSDGRSLISLAVQAGHIVAVQVLIASGCVIDGSIDKVLHYAAAINRVDLMEVLCASFEDIDVNSVDSCGRTPIHVAASRGHVEVARFCVSAGGKTEVLDCDGSSSLHLAAEKGHLEITEYLLDCSYCYIKHVVNREGKTPFSIAVDNGHSHLYDLLHIGDALQRAARAAFKGKIEAAQVLLDHGAQVDAIDDAGYTPLHCAVEAGHMQVALLLIAHGARAEARSLDGAVPLNIIPSLVKPLCQDETKSETEVSAR